MSLFNVFVNTKFDISSGVLTHNVLLPPAVPTPTPMVSMEMVATQWWPPGFAMNQNKLTTTVSHGQQIVLDGHDCGMLIPDITPPFPAQYYYAIYWQFSSRKTAFAASTVKMDNTPVGCAQLGPVPLPMMSCGDPISAPTAFVLLNCFLRQVKVGMTLADLLWGIAGIAISMAIDFVFEMVGSDGKSAKEVVEGYGKRAFSRKAMEQFAKTATERLGETLAKAFIGKMGFGVKAAIKQGVSSLAGLATSSLQGNPTFKYSVGAPYDGAQFSADHKGLDLQTNVAGAQADTGGKPHSLWGHPL